MRWIEAARSRWRPATVGWFPNTAEWLVLTYGNRKRAGVAVQPGTGWLFGAEHGPTIDDEINSL